MSVSLKDIATQLELSTTTVSWVLAGKGDEKKISKETQKKIIACSKKLSYKPNLLARSLNIGISKTLGLILPSINDRFYSQMAEVIEREAQKFGYTLMLCNSESKLEQEDIMINMLRAKRVDGIIIAPTQHSDANIKSMLNDNFPFVLFDRYFPDIDTNYVIMDNEYCSFKLVKHLINKGCKKIAVITTNPHLLILQHRYAGYCKALNQSGIKIDPSLLLVIPFADFEATITNSLDNFFAQHPDIDGIFFISHILAIETLIYMHERGMNVNDFHLACIHEVSAFRALAPKINTARIPIEAMGKEVVNILVQNIGEHSNDGSYQSYKKAVVIKASLNFRD